MTATAPYEPPAMSTTWNTPGADASAGDGPTWWSASALFRDETGRHELQIMLNETGRVSATLFGPEFDWFGHNTAILFPVSAYSVTCSVLVDLTGYDFRSDCFRHAEAAIGATWTMDRTDRTSVEVAGTALVTDLDNRTLTSYQAVRRHPFNHLDLAALPTIPAQAVAVLDTAGGPPPLQPASPAVHEPRHRPWARTLRLIS